MTALPLFFAILCIENTKWNTLYLFPQDRIRTIQLVSIGWTFGRESPVGMQMRNTYINRLQNIQRLRLLERALEELLREEAVMMSGINELYVYPQCTSLLLLVLNTTL